MKPKELHRWSVAEAVGPAGDVQSAPVLIDCGEMVLKRILPSEKGEGLSADSHHCHRFFPTKGWVVEHAAMREQFPIRLLGRPVETVLLPSRYLMVIPTAS